MKKIILSLVLLASSMASADELSRKDIFNIKRCQGAIECRGSDSYGGPCYKGYGGPLYDGYGGNCYAGYGGPLYDGYGGPLYAGYGGNCYKGYGGACDESSSGACNSNSDKCPVQCYTVCE